MKKQVILGDIHGREIWEEIVQKENDFDRLIFIGDYFDTHYGISPSQQLSNFLKICEYKKNSPKEIIMLIGNHDYHYFPKIHELGTTGFQPDMKKSFEKALEDNIKLLQMCFEDEYNNVYTHAGLTKSFIRKTIGTYSAEKINELWDNDPECFGFYRGDWSGNGTHIEQSCIWVRPEALYKDKISNYQVVGHTSVKQLTDRNGDVEYGFYLVDGLENKQYLVCVDGKFEAKQL